MGDEPAEPLTSPDSDETVLSELSNVDDFVTDDQLLTKADEIITLAREKRRDEIWDEYYAAEYELRDPLENNSAEKHALQRHRDEALDAVDDRYEWVKEWFEHACGPGPGASETLLERLGEAKSELLSEQLGLMNAVSTRLSDWRGSAVEGFRDTFVATFAEVAENQLRVVNELIAGVQAQQQVTRRFRADLLQLGEATVDALEDLGGSDVKILLTLLSIGLTVGAAAVSGGSLTVALLSSGITLARAAMDSDEQNVGGDSVFGVLWSFMLRATRVYNEAQDLEDRLAELLGQTQESVEELLAAGRRIVAKDPDLLGELEPGQVQLPDGAR